MNGVVECMTRTVDEMAWYMLAHAGLPATFWPEAVNTAMYIRNQSPTSAIDNGHKTPFQAYTGHLPVLRHLKVFGCRAYAHLHPEQRGPGKFKSRTREAILLGYIEGMTNSIYKLFDIEKRQFLTSGSIDFDENEFPGHAAPGNAASIASRNAAETAQPNEDIPNEILETIHVRGGMQCMQGMQDVQRREPTARQSDNGLAAAESTDQGLATPDEEDLPQEDWVSEDPEGVRLQKRTRQERRAGL